MEINIKNIRVKSICTTLFISLFLSCNNGIEELEKQRDSILSISNLRQGFLDIFISFSDMFTDAFGIKAETPKSEVGKYFTNIEETMKTTKEKLKDVLAKNGDYPKVKEEVEKFIEKLTKIEEGATEAAKGAITGDAIGNAVKDQAALAADPASINLLVKGMKSIVKGVVLKEGKAEANYTKDSDKTDIGKLFSSKKDTDGTDAQAASASASIGVVSGADILQAIAESDESASDQVGIEKAKNAAEIAAAKVEQSKSLNTVKKDAVIAAGIALKAMAKGGKFTIKDSGADNAASTINGAVASAVNKTLSTLIIAIRNTVDSGLKSINEALATVKREDMSADTNESGAAK
ncbi:variable large family protein (plasmid) [Borrelia coriaceae]|uniref:Variable large protein n=1 Tax=Borrelia coriaceae ATCC 43381 TaxID=1408429 RepID=W5SWP6_9SPIR|nr:variable large family protein [Borrelia coriaceae]AHH11619.1 Variable outer membrane protein [Borrelia coriaceae ATCC 43381]UPA17486.1 variable large family protein [Borrelia coriaceae]